MVQDVFMKAITRNGNKVTSMQVGDNMYGKFIKAKKKQPNLADVIGE
jgi:hypothetical protein